MSSAKRLCCLLAFLIALAAGLPAAALDRGALTFTRYDLQVQLTPAEQQIDVKGRITLRNDSPDPQRAVSLQISSTLSWQSIQLGGKPLVFVAEPYTTDIDHTGSVSEAVFTLPTPLAPKETVELEVAYSGTIPADATRLTRFGVPAAVAGHSDWDHLGDDFSAVRGVGYVCWYPVSLPAASLSDGSTLFAALGEWRQRHASSSMQLTLGVVTEKLVATNGRLISQKATNTADGTLHERSYEFSPMGLFPPVFVVGDYTLLSRPIINVLHLPGHQAGAEEFQLAAEKLSPMIGEWLGRQRQKIVVIELPEGYAPFDSGAILFSPVTATERRIVEVTVAHQVAHACLDASRPWVVEGLAHFAQALTRERQDGRKAALGYLQQFRPGLVEAEKQARGGVAAPSAAAAASSSSAGADAAHASGTKPPDTPGTNPAPQNAKSSAAAMKPAQALPSAPSAALEGEPLIRADDDIYYRAKAVFVWWMLRDMLGDEALQRALHQYRAADDREPSYLQKLIEASSHRQLEWFFDDWVYRDRGLPDLRIEAVNARQMLPENITVSVTVVNEGDAAVEVPVTVPTGRGDSTQRLMLPARGKATTRFTVAAAPSEVVVNDGSVPESEMDHNRAKVQSPTGTE